MAKTDVTKSVRGLALLLILLVGVLALVSAAYTLDEKEQAVIVQFGKPVGDAVKAPGLHFKVPLIQEVRRFSKQTLAWDGDPNQIPTRGREFISVDSTARWRIKDPLLFLQSVKDENGGQSRLDDIIDSVVRDMISSTELVEIVRSRDWAVDEDMLRQTGVGDQELELLRKKITVGRQQLEEQILAQAQAVVPKFGIELVDVRIKRLNYVPSVQKQVFTRMISERQRVAEQFRSEGEGRSTDIKGQTDREVSVILSEARRAAEVIRGNAEAEATAIYNKAYSSDAEFFAFFRTLDSYSKSIGKHTTLIIGAESEYFRYLRDITPPKIGE